MQIGTSDSARPGWSQLGGNYESTIGDSQGEFTNFEELQAEYRDLQKIVSALGNLLATLMWSNHEEL